MISRIKTDRELVNEGALALIFAVDEAEYEKACVEMVEILQYARSKDWWAQFEQEAAHA